MRTKYSTILPVAAILSGVVLELNSLHLIGNFLPSNILMKIWPALLIFVGLDLIISQRRFIGAAVVLFFAAALLSTQFMDGGQNNKIWQFFIKVWPILLILFGLDWIFTGRTLIHTIVIITVVIVLIYVLFNVLDIPAIHKLPINIDLTSIIPTSVFDGLMPEQHNNNQQIVSPDFFTEVPINTVEEPITYSSNGNINISIPNQNSGMLNIKPASGTISIKAGGEFDQFLSGTIRLDQAERLSHTAELSGQAAQYNLTSTGNADYSQNSNWDISLTSNRTIDLNTVLNSGYIKADLRSLNLSSVYIENKFGPIDVMVPHSTPAKIRITGSGENIRIYVPSDVSMTCAVTGTQNLNFSSRNYLNSGTTLMPRRTYGNPITVEISANGSSVEIIDIG